MSPQLEMLKGTLDLMVLQTLHAMGALHVTGLPVASSRSAATLSC